MSFLNIQHYDDNRGRSPRAWFLDVRHKVARGLAWPRSPLWRKKRMENIKRFSNPSLFPVWSQYAIPQVVLNSGVYTDKLFTLLNSLPLFSDLYHILSSSCTNRVHCSTLPPGWCHDRTVFCMPYIHFKHSIQGEAQKWKIYARVHKWTYWLVDVPG